MLYNIVDTRDIAQVGGTPRQDGGADIEPASALYSFHRNIWTNLHLLGQPTMRLQAIHGVIGTTFRALDWKTLLFFRKSGPDNSKRIGNTSLARSALASAPSRPSPRMAPAATGEPVI